MMHTFKIHAPLNANETVVEMDGKRVEGVTRIEFAVAAQEAIEVKLTILGYVDITGEFRETDIVRVEREGEHPGLLRARVRRAFQGALPGMEISQINTMVADVMHELEREPS